VAQGSLTSLRGALKERIADFVHGTDGFGNTNPRKAKVRHLLTLAATHTTEMQILLMAAM
jgi:hypothetical protein